MRQILNLLVNASEPVPVSSIIDELWPDPDHSPEWEEKTVHVHVHKLRRRLLPPARIRTFGSSGYALIGVRGVSSIRLPSELKLRPTEYEMKVFRSLLDGRVRSRRSLIMDVYDWREEEKADTRTIDIFITRLRKKLAPGWKIQNVWGQGWKLIKANYA